MNKVILVGNLGANAEFKAFDAGDGVATFSLATSEKWKDKQGEKQEKTEWHRCKLFGKRATALAQYLTKGTKVAIEGTINYGSYEKDGVKHYTTDIKVLNVEFVGGKRNDEQASDTSNGSDEVPTGDDELPF